MEQERPDPEEVRGALRERTGFTEEQIDEAMKGLTDEKGRMPPKLLNPLQIAADLLTSEGGEAEHHEGEGD